MNTRAAVVALVTAMVMFFSACSDADHRARGEARADAPEATAAPAQETAPPDWPDLSNGWPVPASDREAADLFMMALATNNQSVMYEAAPRYAAKESSAFYYLQHQLEADWAALEHLSNPGIDEDTNPDEPEDLSREGGSYEICPPDRDLCATFDHFQVRDRKVTSFHVNNRPVSSLIRGGNFDEVEKYDIRLQYRSALITTKNYLHVVVLVDGRKEAVVDMRYGRATYQDPTGKTYRPSTIIGSGTVPEGSAYPMVFVFENARPGGTLSVEVSRYTDEHFFAKLRVT